MMHKPSTYKNLFLSICKFILYQVYLILETIFISMSLTSCEKQFEYENLAFEGGGVLGYAYVGVVQVLQEYGILKKCVCFSGASAGAMTAGLLALRADPEMLANALASLNANAMVDSSFLLPRNINRFWHYGGWAKGQYLESWYGDLVAKLCDGNRNITLRQVFDKFGTSVVLTGTCVDTGTTKYLCKESDPNLPLVRAVRISAGYPCVFPMVEYQEMQWWDGGIGDNFPIHVFDTVQHVCNDNDDDDDEECTGVIPDKHVYDRIPNMKTLGFKLISKKTDTATAETRARARPATINNVYDAIKSVASMVLEQSRQVHVHELDWKRCVLIDIGSMRATDFDIDATEKEMLISNGRKATEEFLKK